MRSDTSLSRSALLPAIFLESSAGNVRGLAACMEAEGALFSSLGSHVVTIEDTYELQPHRSPQRHPMVTAMFARAENTEGAGEVTLAQLTRMALRVSLDRVVPRPRGWPR